jgi:hypothetical protein
MGFAIPGRVGSLDGLCLTTFVRRAVFVVCAIVAFFVSDYATSHGPEVKANGAVDMLDSGRAVLEARNHSGLGRTSAEKTSHCGGRSATHYFKHGFALS